ncbi:MAG: AAA family ATPase, partial [Lachnospiraceae bacterium]|nr:AAA family ATPase [Lachnospiraceae bacterium]
MFDKIYLLSAELNGVKNIDKKVRLTFYKQTIDRSFDITNYRVKAIFGENGCGKTALITAFSIARDIIFGGISTDNTSKQNVLEELINKKEKRYEFSCEFIICEEKGNTVYKYSLYMEHNESGYFISREQLSKKSGNYMNNSYKDVFIVNAGKLDYLNADSDTAKKSREESLNVLKNQS